MSERPLFTVDGKELHAEPNPCVYVFGPGPDGKTCKTCAHLVRREYAKTYYKCDKRSMSRSEATDHRVGWRACGKYEEEER
jgi:hypothetical protein